MPARHDKAADGKYHIRGAKFDMLDGSRAQVMHKTAYRTTGGLVKKDLMYNKHSEALKEKVDAFALKACVSCRKMSEAQTVKANSV